MPDEIIVALFSLAGTLIGSLAGIMTANRLMSYRVEQLEKKVDAWGSLRDRVVASEHDLTTALSRIDKLCCDMESYHPKVR